MNIHGWHAHVYYDAASLERAERLCEAAAARFPLRLGRLHRQAVGPHPDWSCQLAFEHAQFAEIVPWLALNRDGLDILLHPLTGDDLADHRDHALWLGRNRPLNLAIFGG